MARDLRLGTGHTDLRTTTVLSEDHDAKWWACLRCTKPDYLVEYLGPGYPPNLTVRCAINRFAPLANSIMCPQFEQIPGIEELWQYEDRAD